RSANGITGADLRAYAQQRLQAGAAAAQINRELAALRRGYSLALKDGILPTRPHFELLPERNQRKGFFTDSEIATLCKHLPADIRDAVLFLSETGWRIMEGLTREWKDVDFTRGFIALGRDETKNEQSRIFPFTETLRSLLLQRKAITENIQKEKGVIIPYVFHVNGSKLFSGNKPSKLFRKVWKKACESAGLVGRVPHDFRRSAAMTLIRSGIDEQTAMDLLGHKTPSIFRRYRIVTDQEKFDAVKRLDRARKQKLKNGAK
ncbi:MAG: tyrosine-type recombinase/integrase, partial [Acidobacteriota bacterium]